MTGSDDPGMGQPPVDMMIRDEGAEYEAALRRLPEAHSLALRLRDCGAADDVICEYLRIEPEGLAMLLEVASRKLDTELGQH